MPETISTMRIWLSPSVAWDEDDLLTKDRKVDNLCYAALKYMIKRLPHISFDSDHVPPETGVLEESSKF